MRLLENILVWFIPMKKSLDATKIVEIVRRETFIFIVEKLIVFKGSKS